MANSKSVPPKFKHPASSTYIVSPSTFFHTGKYAQSPTVKLWQNNTPTGPIKTPVAQIFNQLKNTPRSKTGEGINSPKAVRNESLSSTGSDRGQENEGPDCVIDNKHVNKPVAGILREEQNILADTEASEEYASAPDLITGNAESIPSPVPKNVDIMNNESKSKVTPKLTRERSLGGAKKPIMLKNWVIKPVGEGKLKICVQGDRVLDGEMVCWYTSAITERISTSIVATASQSRYQLYKKMDVKQAEQLSDLPHKLLLQFSYGFPKNWENLLKQNHKARKESNRKKMNKHKEKQTQPSPKSNLKKTPKTRLTEKAPGKQVRPVKENGSDSQTDSPSNCSLDMLPQTRSGRHVVPPLDYWRCERLHVTRSDDSDTTLLTGTPDYITAFKMDIIKTRQRTHRPSVTRKAKPLKSTPASLRKEQSDLKTRGMKDKRNSSEPGKEEDSVNTDILVSPEKRENVSIEQIQRKVRRPRRERENISEDILISPKPDNCISSRTRNRTEKETEDLKTHKVARKRKEKENTNEDISSKPESRISSHEKESNKCGRKILKAKHKVGRPRKDKENLSGSKETLSDRKQIRNSKTFGNISKPSRQERKSIGSSKEPQEKEWSKREIQAFYKAIRSFQTSSPEFWQLVSEYVITRTREECIEFHQQISSPAKKTQPGKKTAKETVKVHQITGGKKTLKRKRQLQELMENYDDGYNDDLFESTPYRNKPAKIPRLASIDDSFDEFYDAAKFETPANLRATDARIRMPVSESKTPAHSVFSPGFIRNDIKDADRYVHRLKHGRKELWNLPSKKQSEADARVVIQPESSKSRPLEPIGNLFDVHREIEEEDDEEEDFYFSD